MLKMKTSGVVLVAPFEGDRMGVKLTKRHALGTGGVRGDEGLVVAVEAGDDSGDDVLLTHGAADGCKLVGVGADLGKIICHGQGALPEDRHVQLDLDDAGAAMDGVHLLNVRPDGTRGLQLMHLLQYLIRHRGEEVAEDDLVLAEPGGVLRIGSTNPLVIGGKQPIGSLFGAINVAGGVGDAKGWKDLSFP